MLFSVPSVVRSSGFVNLGASGPRGTESTQVRAGRRMQMNCEFEHLIWPPHDSARMRRADPYLSCCPWLNIRCVAAEVMSLLDGEIAKFGRVQMLRNSLEEFATWDTTVLAKLYASGFLPEVWVPDPGILALRRQVTRRTQLGRQRSRLKNLIQSILHANLAQ